MRITWIYRFYGIQEEKEMEILRETTLLGKV